MLRTFKLLNSSINCIYSSKLPDSEIMVKVLASTALQESKDK